ncbi:unnamed protein product [Cylicocyclus nassatus]|uniref:Uncharacterized protein n=1 Tax=Cylicocyclus nassatus TaxID=53992 RepID=A0AA36DQ51_CYLNA|nr:unnamed protein product [Cylicocyclus nassatus]
MMSTVSAEVLLKKSELYDPFSVLVARLPAHHGDNLLVIRRERRPAAFDPAQTRFENNALLWKTCFHVSLA